MNNLFFSTTVHLTTWPPNRILNDPVELHTTDEAIDKMHRFCHEIYNIPITWIVSYDALKKYANRLKDFCEKYGDEVGILEFGIFSEEFVDGKAEIYQSWVEEAGMTRQSSVNHAEDEVPGTMTWYALGYDEQKKALTFLKKRYEEILGTEVVTFASPFFNKDTLAILKELGFKIVWGNNWHYLCEGMNHRGSLPHVYYKGTKDTNSPAKTEEDRGLLSVPWHTWDFCSYLESCRMGIAASFWNTNPMEYTNRGYGLDQFNYFEKVVDTHIKNRAYNPFIYMPLQLEATWMDEGPAMEGFIDQYPAFNVRDTETFYNQIEVCLRKGATCMTQKEFAKWHEKEFGKTTEHIWYGEQLIPQGMRLNGIDGEYSPILIIANEDAQYVFRKADGFNYIFRWLYDGTPVPEEDTVFVSGPPAVQTNSRFSVRLYAGVQITPNSAEYTIDGLEFSSKEAYKDYAGAIWTANMPEYVNEDNILSDGFTSYRLLKQDDIFVFFADMKEGENSFKISSKEPNKYISMFRQEQVGRHYEIWIKNDGAPVKVSRISTNIGPNRKLGCFWWNSENHRSMYKFGPCTYNQHTGEFSVCASYPASFELKTGYNRLSLELL